MSAAESGALIGRGALAVGTRAGASRILVADPLLGVATERGVIQQALHQMTAGGTRTAVLSVERGGLIRAGSEPLAQLELTTGQIFRNGRVHGVLDEGVLFEFTEGGARTAIGQLRGFIPGRAVRSTSFGGGSAIQIQEGGILVDVIRIHEGRYLIRLANGSSEWVGPEVVALTLVAAAGDRTQCPPEGHGVLVRSSGETIPFDSCQRLDGVYRLETPEGLVLVDAADVRETVAAMIVADAASAAVPLTGGETYYGQVEQAGEVVRIVDEGGRLIIADLLRLQGTRSPQPPSPGAA